MFTSMLMTLALYVYVAARVVQWDRAAGVSEMVALWNAARWPWTINQVAERRFRGEVDDG